MAFEKIIFWCEFPKKVNWTYVGKLLNKFDLNIGVYVASKNRKEFEDLKKRINRCKHITEIGVWPVLSKKKGYWFSGQTAKEDIDRLREYEGLRVKIDLEAPFKGTWNRRNFLRYLITRFGKKGDNKEYLEETIDWLQKNSEVELIVNEFPFFTRLLMRSGTFIDVNRYKNLDKNLMVYTSMAGPILRPFWKRYRMHLLKKAYKRYGNKLMCSVGLIGPGILGDEGYYKKPRQLRDDLKSVSRVGIKKVAVYSLESLIDRKNPSEWMEVVKEFKS